MYLSSFALIEPEDKFYFYQPSWLNAWEAHLYNLGLKSTRKKGWGLKRFGTDGSLYAGEMIRNPQYIKYLDAMEQTADAALQALSTKERMKLFKSRTAFIYADSWGEAGLLESISSALHISMLDTLPKNLVKKFSITEPTCKMRGEKYAFTQAMSMAQDYLSWDVFDYVVICCAYRAIPIMVFSEEDITVARGAKSAQQADGVNLTVERTGCFIFSRHESAWKVNSGRYMAAGRGDISQLNAEDVEIMAFAGLREKSFPADMQHKIIRLADIYGHSGCLTPALSFEYLRQHPVAAGKMRTVVPDNLSGYHYFDIEYSAG
ncbi:hypothetical protein [Kosakonia radicincitans]|uniref:hypothetical protein n=1 Tax=Kosakonia radicincitans TaxID=283686 RepID=UPI0005C2F24A|nr:hypothetical protein [Kosakonia radicincitans]KIS42428.1 hypothetical protein LG58_3260 [Kosakonia radicincitans YD4]